MTKEKLIKSLSLLGQHIVIFMALPMLRLDALDRAGLPWCRIALVLIVDFDV